MTISPHTFVGSHFDIAQRASILSYSELRSSTHQYTLMFCPCSISSPGNILNTPNSKPATLNPI